MENLFKYADDIVKNLYKLDIKRSNYTPLAREIEDVLSSKTLDSIIDEYKDINVASKIADNDNRIALHKNSNEFDIFETEVKKELNVECKQSGFFWYPINSYCGWHTNNNAEGERIYFTWAQEDNKSFFRYQDDETGEIITKWDKKGWKVNRFMVSRETPCWHCVGSRTNRISIGFKIIK